MTYLKEGARQLVTCAATMNSKRAVVVGRQNENLTILTTITLGLVKLV